MMPLDPNAKKSKAPAAAGPAAAPADPTPAGPPPALSAPPGVAALWHAVTQRWLAILVIGGGLGVAGAVAGWLVAPGKYTAVATLHLDPHPPRGLYESPEDFSSFRANMATQVKSDPVLEAALKKPQAAELAEVRAHGTDALAWMRTAVVVDDKTPGPEALRLDVASDRAEDAATLANLWAQAAGEVYSTAEEAKIKDRIKQTQQNHRDKTEVLRKKRIELQGRRDVLGLEDPKVIDAKLQAAQAAVAGMQTQEVAVDLELKKLDVLKEQLSAALQTPTAADAPWSAVDEVIERDFPQNPAVRAQVDQLLGLQKKMGERLALLRPEDREGDSVIVQYKAGIVEIQKKLDAEREQLRPLYAKRLLAKVEQDAAGLKGQRETLESKLAEKDSQITALRNSSVATARSNPEVEGLQAEVDEMEAQVKRLGDEQANLQASLPLAPRLTVMEAASPPTWPTLDKKVKAAGGAFLGLFGLVFLGVAGLEFRSRRVYRSDDVSQGLGLPLMGTVPTVAAPARAAAPVADDDSVGPVIESMAAIRTALLHAGRSETLRVLMVASAVSGEGKTSLASNLAVSLARGGRRTLLVDGDLRNPAVHKVFNVTAGPGFAELLRGEVEPAQVVQNTTLENLSVLAAGAADRRAVQALAQEGVLRTVLDELKEQYDFLIVDASPVLPVADALLIGEHADAVLLSVMRNVSRLPAVHAAQQRLSSLGIRVLGAVVIGEGLEAYGDVRYPSPAASPIETKE